jgi:DNA repair protein RecO (recombination protein O)
MAIQTTEAIVLRVIDYSETSLIVWCFTRDHGRVHVMAKGARRPRSVFEGALEPLVRGELVFYPRSRKKADALDIAKEFDPQERHTGLRRDLARLYRGLYVAEVLLEISEKEMPAPDAFAAASECLAALASDDLPRLDAHIMRCELRLLDAAGLAPALDQCAACGRSLTQGPLWFAPAAGGVLCPEHAPQHTARGQSQRLSASTLNTLSALRAGATASLGRGARGELRDLLDGFFSWHLGKQLKLARYLRG